MTTTTMGRSDVVDEFDEDRYVTTAFGRAMAGIARILLGFVFLWAFLDKTFGFGFATPAEQRWMFGTGDGSPTYGFLNFGTNPNGPFVSFFQGLADKSPGNWVNWAFMLALLGAGVALILGVFMRFATIGGTVLLVLMYLAEAPWATYTDQDGNTVAANNPIIDDHIVYSVVLLLLLAIHAGRYWGLGDWWERSVPWIFE